MFTIEVRNHLAVPVCAETVEYGHWPSEDLLSAIASHLAAQTSAAPGRGKNVTTITVTEVS